MDFQRLAKAMQNSELPPLVEEDMGSLKLDQTIQRAPKKEKPSNPTKTTLTDLPKTPRISDRLAAKENSTCSSGCCISLLALLLATGQATALISLHPNGASHVQSNISEKTNIYLEVRNHTERNNDLLQDPISSKFSTDPSTITTLASYCTTWYTLATRSPPRVPKPVRLSQPELRTGAPDKPKPNQRISQIQKLIIILVHLWINLAILLNRSRHPHLSFWFPHLTIFVLLWMIKTSAALKIGENVLLYVSSMMLHKPSELQDQSNFSLITWAVLAA